MTTTMSPERTLVTSVPGVVGLPVRRVEDRRFVTGAASYVGNVDRPNMLHLAFVRSPLPHAELKGVSVGPALSVRGVVDAVSGKDIIAACAPIRADMGDETWQPSGQWPLAVGRVRYVGEPIAAVVATSRYEAEDGVDRVELSLEELPPVADVEAALAPGAPVLHEGWADNRFIRRRFEAGDVDRAFAAAHGVVELRCRMGRHSGVPLEPRGCIAEYDPGQRFLTLWSSHQMPHMLRTAIADLIHLPEHRFRVICPDVGGGFGVKSCLYPEEVVACLLALRLERPVRWLEDRREHFLAAAHARDHLHDIRVAYSPEGEIMAIDVSIVVDAGAYSLYPWTAALEPMSALANIPGPYRVRSYRAEACAVTTNKTPGGPCRGVGRVPACFTIERALDQVARRLGVDPLEIRRRNLVRPDEFPYETVVGSVFDSGSFLESITEVARAADVDGLRRWQRAERGRGRFVGIGIACFAEQGAHGVTDYARRQVPVIFAHEKALVRIEPSGHASVFVGVHSQGQGMETTLAQIAAAELGLQVGDVRVVLGDTESCPYGGGAFGSRAAVVCGGATLLAAREVRRKLVDIAAHTLGIDPEDVILEHGQAAARNDTEVHVSIRELARSILLSPHTLPAGTDTTLEATASYAVESGRGPFSNAAHLAVVEVDVETGAVRVLRYFVVSDCGRLINPLIVEGQTHGAVAQGIGGALFEELAYDEHGNPLSTTLLDYLLPNSWDIPSIVVAHLETPSPFTVNGVKGVGESGTIGPAAAIAGAVEDSISALGPAVVSETPLTPERVLAYVDAARSGTGGSH